MRLLWRNINQTRNRLQMKKPILEFSELAALGFRKQQSCKLENGDYYYCIVFRKNDNEISITYEYDSNNNFIGGYVDFNCEKLSGRELTKKDIQLLIEIM